MSCWRSRRSAIFFSFFAMRMKRRFTARPKPRRSGCVTVKPKLELVNGLYAELNEFSVSRELLYVTFNCVPGPKPCTYPPLNNVVLVTSAFAPPIEGLVIGDVWWFQFS